MITIRESGYHLGVNSEDAWFFSLETEKEKAVLAELIEKFHEGREHPV